ncbi:MAG TPA: ABC transporter permease [Kiloniellales bacterium]|jgi:spermidine/putrescine transport system permease protein
MTSQTVLRMVIGLYIVLFFSYLFGPLVLMGITAFNATSYPQVNPWEGFTLRWFTELARDDLLLQGIGNSLWIGLGVICLSVPIGLAGAIVMTQIHRRARSIYYTIVVSPVLTPGVILGISTLVFWDRMGTALNADYETLFYDGIFLTIVGQSNFIAAYCMLVFLARLQRFDYSQEEAALDLGATHGQVFRQILLPFLRPAIFSAAVLAFLTSFENYNTTVFTIQAESTLTTVLAGRVRMGTTPELSALAVIIIGITLIGAVSYELLRRRENARQAPGADAAKLESHGRQPQAAASAPQA